MNLNLYNMGKAKTQVCLECNKELPKNRKFFRRNLVNGHDIYHTVCRECEDRLKNKDVWKGDLLLCNKCHQYKPVSEFTTNHTKNKERNYLSYCCKSCTNQRQANHERSLSDDNKLHRCLNFRLLGAKDRAKTLNIECTITLDFLKSLWEVQKGICALSGIPMTYELRKGRIPTNVSIDKIDRTKGYIPTNVQLVCMACNQIKLDLTDSEMYNFCKKIVENYENKNNKST